MSLGAAPRGAARRRLLRLARMGKAWPYGTAGRFPQWAAAASELLDGRAPVEWIASEGPDAQLADAFAEATGARIDQLTSAFPELRQLRVRSDSALAASLGVTPPIIAAMRDAQLAASVVDLPAVRAMQRSVEDLARLYNPKLIGGIAAAFQDSIRAMALPVSALDQLRVAMAVAPQLAAVQDSIQAMTLPVSALDSIKVAMAAAPRLAAVQNSIAAVLSASNLRSAYQDSIRTALSATDLLSMCQDSIAAALPTGNLLSAYRDSIRTSLSAGNLLSAYQDSIKTALSGVDLLNVYQSSVGSDRLFGGLVSDHQSAVDTVMVKAHRLANREVGVAAPASGHRELDGSAGQEEPQDPVFWPQDIATLLSEILARQDCAGADRRVMYGLILAAVTVGLVLVQIIEAAISIGLSLASSKP
jgi:hypothetical protein